MSINMENKSIEMFLTVLLMISVDRVDKGVTKCTLCGVLYSLCSSLEKD